MGSKAVGFLTFNFGANMGGFNKAMKKAQRKVSNFGKSMKRVGSSMTTNLTMPIIGLGAIAIKTFADFEQSMLKVKAVSGATASEFKSLEENAKRLGSQTMFTASQVAGLQLELSKLGLTPEEINKSTDSILTLAQATSHDLSESAIIVASTMNSFNMEASESAKVADMFAVASSNAAIDMTKLSVAMPTVGATANAVGVPLDGLTAMMMTLADSGMEASTMGTHLRKIFVELATKGIDFDDAMNQINTSTNKVATATELFGKRAFGAALILADNTKKTADYNVMLDNSTGKAKEMADTMDSGASGAMRRLASQAEGVAISLGAILIPVFEKLMGFVQKALGWWSGLDSGMKNNIVTIALLAAAIGPVVSLVGTLAVMFGALVSPIALAVAAIVGIVVAFAYVRENWEAFKERLGDWNWIRNALIQVLQWFIEYNPLSLLMDGFNSILEFFGREKMENPFKDISDSLEGLKVETKEYENEFGSFMDAMKNQATEVADAMGLMGNPMGLGGGSSEGSEGGEDEEIIGDFDIDETYAEHMARLNPITEETTKSLKEIWGDFWDDWGEGIAEGIEMAQKAMSSISNLASAVAKKETSELANEKAKQQELHDADYERQLGRIENSMMSEEAKQIAIDDLNTSFATKKETMDQAMAVKEKAMKQKQARRDKAMAIMNAIINGVSAVVASLPNIPLSIFVGGLAAASVATIASTPIPAFAEGGIISGPTVGLMGEYPGAGAGNPEVVAPLKKLQGMMGGGSQHVEVTGKISGNDILLISQKAQFNRNRFV
tara:strand:+ start:8268 stop:10619 length:2352 start_codon:yes stop_codon:yes gene_type:complete